MPLLLKTVNGELERRGVRALLARGDGYFYFWGGDAIGWCERTIRVPTLQSLTIEQWIERYYHLKEKNRQARITRQSCQAMSAGAQS